MTSYEEWRVTGDPGDGFPAYSFTWSPAGPPAWEFPENEARNFVRLIESVGGWPDGPHLHRRTATVTEWQPVEDARVSASLSPQTPQNPAPRDTGTPEVWSEAVAPGGYVCGVADPDRPDGICGMPVEDEPCGIHNPLRSDERKGQA